MFGDIIDLFRENPEIFKSKLLLYVIAGIIAIVLLSLILDKVRKYIRGLDTAAIGALVFWLGYKVSQLAVPKGVAEIMVLAGTTLIIVGLLVFIFKVVFKRKKNKNKTTGKHDAQDRPEESKGE